MAGCGFVDFADLGRQAEGLPLVFVPAPPELVSAVGDFGNAVALRSELAVRF
jgi:hypothetical protein